MAMILTPEDAATVTAIRAKAAEGTATIEDYRLATRLLRGGRESAAASTTSAAKRAKAKAVIPSADDMLNELGGI